MVVLLEMTRNVPVSLSPERDARSQGISSDSITGVEPEYSDLSITRTWRKEPGHQQWWYYWNWPRVFRFQYYQNVTQGARASAVIIIPELTRNIPVSVLPEHDARSQGISSDSITGVEPEYSDLSITRTWRKEPGHQQWWYYWNWPRVFRFQYYQNVTQGARASAVIIIPELTRNIPVSVLPEHDARSQGISNGGIIGDDPEYSGLSITRTWRKEPGHQQW